MAFNFPVTAGQVQNLCQSLWYQSISVQVLVGVLSSGLTSLIAWFGSKAAGYRIRIVKVERDADTIDDAAPTRESI